MTMVDLLDEIKLELTGGILELEIEDSTIEFIIKQSLRELDKYYDETTLVTIPFSSCIDLSDSELDLKEKVNHVVKIYRTEAIGAATGENAYNDPLYMQQWMIFSSGNGSMYSLKDYVMNYAAYAELNRLKNTMATDLSFKLDKTNNKLYINSVLSKPDMVTVEYVPRLIQVEQIKDEYWTDVLQRLALARTKIVLGRIRTAFKQSNALWTLDGETLLNEGNTEKKELEDMLIANSNLIAYVD